MERLFQLIKRYKFFLIFLGFNIIILFLSPEKGIKSLSITRDNLLQMLSLLPPIFILLGLIDIWVDRETMMKYMGENAGVKGGVIAFILGSAAAGPLYAAFPISAVLLKKGVKLSNVFIFIGAWSTTKIPLILFEASNLGWNYMLLRLAFNIIGIIVIALILEKSISNKDKEALYNHAKTM